MRDDRIVQAMRSLLRGPTNGYNEDSSGDDSDVEAFYSGLPAPIDDEDDEEEELEGELVLHDGNSNEDNSDEGEEENYSWFIGYLSRDVEIGPENSHSQPEAQMAEGREHEEITTPRIISYISIADLTTDFPLRSITESEFDPQIGAVEGGYSVTSTDDNSSSYINHDEPNSEANNTGKSNDVNETAETEKPRTLLPIITVDSPDKCPELEAYERMDEEDVCSVFGITEDDHPAYYQPRSPTDSDQSPMSGKRKHDDSYSDSGEEFEKSPKKLFVKDSLFSSPYFGGLQHSKIPDSPNKNDNSPYYSNPMESDLDGDGETFRGDRIGNTSYSERNVIKILMNWMKKLESDIRKSDGVSGNEDLPEKKNGAAASGPTLDSGLDEELSLLWDLSSENDVIDYLMDKNIMYTLIKDTLISSNCERLKEIALGIFANLLSSRNVLNDYPNIDPELGLIPIIVSEIRCSSNTAVLLQAFSVLERILWYVNEVKANISWILAILNLEFVNTVNFLLESSTNVLLLEKIILTILPLFETLSRTDVFESPESEETDENEADFETKMTHNYDVFCETSFVGSLNEGLKELLKCSIDNDADMDEFQITPRHIQIALCSGLGCLCYLQKFKTGQNVLKKENESITDFLKKFFGRFRLYTEKIERDKAFEYYVSGLSLMSFCHRGFTKLDSSAVIRVVQAGLGLTQRDDLKLKSEGEYTDKYIVDSTAIALHEHLAELGNTFGLDQVDLSCAADKDLISFLKVVDETAKNYFTQNQ